MAEAFCQKHCQVQQSRRLCMHSGLQKLKTTAQWIVMAFCKQNCVSHYNQYRLKITDYPGSSSSGISIGSMSRVGSGVGDGVGDGVGNVVGDGAEAEWLLENGDWEGLGDAVGEGMKAGVEEEEVDWSTAVTHCQYLQMSTWLHIQQQSMLLKCRLLFYCKCSWQQLGCHASSCMSTNTESADVLSHQIPQSQLKCGLTCSISMAQTWPEAPTHCTAALRRD